MSEKLNFILELTDKITAPIKSIANQFTGLQSDLLKNTKGVDEVGNSIMGLRKRMSGFEQSSDSAFRTDHIRKYNGLIKKTKEELRKLEDLPPKKHQENWQDMALGANQMIGVLDSVSDSLSFTSEFNDLKTNVQRFSKLTGDELNSVTEEAFKIGEVFNQDSEEIIRSANAMTDQIGGSFEDNLTLIRQGFEKGANLNNDMLDQLKEYGPQLKAAGLDGAQGLAIMAQAAEKGILSDKAIDSIKEAGLSLREMGKPQVEALKGIGIEVEQLAGKTTFEAVQMISKSMKGATAQAKQLVLADIFKGAGEDAGAGFIEGLSTMETDLSKIEGVKEAGSQLKEIFASVKATVASSLGSVGTYLPMLSSGIGTIVGITTLIQTLSKVKWIATAAQWVWNTAVAAGGLAMAFLTSPIGLTIIGLAALTAGIVWAYNEFEEFRGVVHALGAGLMQIGSNIFTYVVTPFTIFGEIWDGIVQAFTGGGLDGIISGLKKLGSFFLTGLLQPILQVVKGIDAIAGTNLAESLQSATGMKDLTEGIGDAVNDGYNEGVADFNNDGTAVDVETGSKLSTIDPTLSFSASAPGSSTKKGKGGGSNSGFKTADKKSITVTIENLIENFTISTTNISEGKAKIKQMVEEALVSSVKDFEISLSQG